MATNNKNFRVKNGLDVNGEINAAAVGGDEGGQINLEKPATGTTLSGNVSIDVYQNKLRIFDAGGTNKGAYIDLSAATDGVGSNLLAGGGGGITSIVEDTTPQLGGDLDAQSFDITALNAVTMDTTPSGVPIAAGTISWDPDMETLAVQLDSAVTLQVGQEHVIRVKNADGANAIPDRTVVMFAGATGDTVTVSPAVSDGSVSSDYLVGITTEEIPADGFGFVTQLGFVNGVNTAAWTVGTILYPDPAVPGGLTSTQPVAPAWCSTIAAVTKQNASSGRLLVRAITGDVLNRIHDVEISSPADNELLAYNSADGTWINQTAEEAGVANLSGATFTGNVAGTNISVTGNVNATTFNGSGAGLTNIPTANLSGAVSNGQLANSTITIAGRSVALGGSNTISANDLSDVAVTSPQPGDTLVYNGSSWENRVLSQNYLLNSNFSVWQRGTTFAADGYCADRWYFDETGVCTVTQETTEVPTGFQYSLKAYASTASDSVDIYQVLESAVVIPLRGKTVTFSFLLKCSSDFITTATGTSQIIADYSTVSDGRTSQTTSIGTQSITPTDHSDWAIASYTFTVPSDAVGLKVGFEPSLTANVSPFTATYYMTGAMLEEGSTRTYFRTQMQNNQAEAEACKTYYEVWTANSAVTQGIFPADAHSSTTGRFVVFYSANKRTTTPTVTFTGGADTFRLSMDGTDAQVNSANCTVTSNGVRGLAVEFTTTGMTAGNGTYIYMGASATAKLEVSCEL